MLPALALGLGSMLGGLFGGGGGSSSPPGISQEEKDALRAEQERRKQLFQLGMPSLTSWMEKPSVGLPQEDIERMTGAYKGTMGETIGKLMPQLSQEYTKRFPGGGVSGLEAGTKAFALSDTAKNLSSAIRDILLRSSEMKQGQEAQKASMGQALAGAPPSALESNILSNISQRNLSSWEAEQQRKQQQGQALGGGLASLLSLAFPESSGTVDGEGQNYSRYS